MKEIKLAKTTLEAMSEVTLGDPKDRKKDKRLTNDRDKRKIEKEKLKNHGVRKVVSKRKFKDESPELQEVENKFFDIVKMVILK